MDYDTQKAARVWQRVQTEKQEMNTAQRGDHLPALIIEQLQLSAVYLQLSRQLPGRDGAVFVRLAREAKGQAACLKGILVLMDGPAAELSCAPAQFSTMDAMLRRCYGKELRLLKEYENRQTDPEYGSVFARLAERGREHCWVLLELIGRIVRPR